MFGYCELFISVYHEIYIFSLQIIIRLPVAFSVHLAYLVAFNHIFCCLNKFAGRVGRPQMNAF